MSAARSRLAVAVPLAMLLAGTGCGSLHLSSGNCSSTYANSSRRVGPPAYIQRIDSVPGVVTGNVRDASTGAALGGATVELRPGRYETSSDSSGAFRFVGVGIGPKTVSARRSDYVGQSAVVHVEGGAGVDIAFQLAYDRCDRMGTPVDAIVRKPGVIPRSAPPRIP